MSLGGCVRGQQFCHCDHVQWQPGSNPSHWACPHYRTKFKSASPTCSKTKLLLPCCGEGEYTFSYRAPSKENGQLMLKGPKLPVGLHARVFKDNIKGKSHWVCDWLMTILLIGWCWGDRVIFQEFQSSVFWLQPVWGLGACSQHVIHTFYLVEGSVLGSAKQPKDTGQDIIYSSWGGTKCLVSDLWLNCCSGYYYFPCLVFNFRNWS